MQNLLDQIYSTKPADFYMSLYDSMSSAGLLETTDGNNADRRDDLVNCEDPLIQQSMELLGDIVKRDFIEKHHMTKSEAASVSIYTYDFGPEEMEKNIYFVVNRSLYQKQMENINKYLCYIIHLLRGLRKLDPTQATVLYRGMKSGANFTEADIGKEFVWDSFTSTSSDENAAYKFLQKASQPTLFEIRGKFRGYSVRSLSFSSTEDEIIIEPGMHFVVKEVKPYSRLSNCQHVVIEVLDTPPVLANAVQFFTEEEKRREYQIKGEDLMGYATRELCMSPFQEGVNPDLALRLVKAAAWYPRAISGYLSMQGTSRWVHALVTASTRSFFPTLSEIKDKKAVNDLPYTVNQISVQDNGFVSQKLMTLGYIPCGISTKIPTPLNVQFPQRFPATQTYALCSDTMEVIKQAHALYPGAKVTCLNMGGQDKPGGGWKMGAVSLEELLFMRTTLSASLEDYLYPMKNLECIYTKDVIYIRNGMNQGYRFLDPNERFSFDVVTTCAFNLKRPIYVDGKKVRDEIIPFDDVIENITYQKIRAIFSACASNGADVLILGALGCGAFSNPPDRIAMLFKRALQEFAGVFHTIIFSILDNKTAYAFSEIIVGQGAGQICAGVKHNDIREVQNACCPYAPMNVNRFQ